MNRMFVLINILKNAVDYIHREDMMKSVIQFKFLTKIHNVSVVLVLGVIMMLTSMGCDRTENVPPDSIENSGSLQSSATQDMYDQLYTALGQETVDRLKSELGAGELDYLAQGIGASNIITLVNGIGDMNKLIALVGDDYAVPSTGLGVIRVVNLINGIEYWMQQPRYDGLVRNEDTLLVIIDLVNAIDLADITDKIVALIDYLGITRYMTDPEDAGRLEKLTKLLAHTEDTGKIIALLQDLSVSDASIKLGDILTGLDDTEPLVEILDSVSVISKMVELVSSDNAVPAATIVDAVNALDTGCTPKFAYVLTSVDAPPPLGTTDEFSFLLALLKGVSDVINVTQLINELEDGTTWTGQVNGVQTWNAVLDVPFSDDSGMVRLVDIVQGLAAGSAGYEANVRKLVVLIDALAMADQNNEGMTKMMRLIQDLISADDLIALLDTVADPLSDTVPIFNLADLMRGVSLGMIPEFKQLVDGQRLPGNTGDQSVYLGKLYDLISGLDPSNDGPEKTVELIENMSDPDRMVDLIMDVASIDNLVTIVENIDISIAYSAETLMYLLENLSDASKLTSLVDDVTTLDNIYTLINDVADVSGADAGQILLDIMDNIANIDNLVFILNELTLIDNMITVVNTSGLAGASKIASLINSVSSDTPLVDNYWDPLDTGSAAYMGKIVNLMENINDPLLLAAVIEGITDINKLSKLVNNVDNSDYLVSLMNEIDDEPNTGAVDLVGLMNNIIYGTWDDPDDDISKLVSIVTTLDGTRYDLVAQLLTPYSGSDQGLGFDDMASLITTLTVDTDSGINKAEELGTLLLNVSDPLLYAGAGVDAREGLVRMISSGVTYLAVDFPGLGTAHVAENLINQADDIQDLLDLVNNLDMQNLVPLIGCTDSVGDEGDDGIGPFDPDFHTPCSAIGLGW